ncbi:hypothetical protein T261_7748 [Streptomyces lydicus]|nr:hypothetical protein T261_7748 [Streptomyces lydicus]
MEGEVSSPMPYGPGPATSRSTAAALLRAGRAAAARAAAQRLPHLRRLRHPRRTTYPRPPRRRAAHPRIRQVLPCTTGTAAVQSCPGALDRQSLELAAAREVLRETITGAEGRRQPAPR